MIEIKECSGYLTGRISGSLFSYQKEGFRFTLTIIKIYSARYMAEYPALSVLRPDIRQSYAP